VHTLHFDLSLQASQMACEGMNLIKSVNIHSIVLVIGLFSDQESLLNAQLAS
jgi:hypothetical protein